MSYEELLALKQNIDHLLGFTERDVEWREIEFYWQGNRPRKDVEWRYYVVRRAGFEHDGNKRHSVRPINGCF